MAARGIAAMNIRFETIAVIVQLNSFVHCLLKHLHFERRKLIAFTTKHKVYFVFSLSPKIMSVES